MNFYESFNSALGVINSYLGQFYFFNIWPFGGESKLPLVVVWLVFAAVYSTLRLNFINITGFKHAIDVVRGKYDDKNDTGDVSHFQALSAALSATLGLGNIAGVALAISVGGPGATFWMIVAGFLGMSAKFAECTLAQLYREVRPDGRIMGGAMEYLSKGLKEKGFAKTGSFLAALFAIFCMGGSLGGGSAFQISQAYSSMAETFTSLQGQAWAFGLFMAVIVGVVILGGIQRIAKVAASLVPAMCVIYILLCIAILAMYYQQIPQAFQSIITGAFTPEAGYGGVIGVLVVGFQRAAFSNEAGVGSAAIAHSAAKTSHPVREGIVALLEPFIDTVVVCTMTALVIVVTGVYNNPEYAEIRAASQGATLTLKAFGGVFSWAPYVLAVSIFFFAYLTVISWYYYGERCFTYLFGEKYCMIFKWFFIFVVFISTNISAGNILDFSDLMLLGMAFPNVIGVYLLFDKIKDATTTYMSKLKNNKFD
jgi:alanine or glycine:cation symporter, AGCS family